MPLESNLSRTNPIFIYTPKKFSRPVNKLHTFPLFFWIFNGVLSRVSRCNEEWERDKKKQQKKPDELEICEQFMNN